MDSDFKAPAWRKPCAITESECDCAVLYPSSVRESKAFADKAVVHDVSCYKHPDYAIWRTEQEKTYSLNMGHLMEEEERDALFDLFQALSRKARGTHVTMTTDMVVKWIKIAYWRGREGHTP